MAPKRIIKTAAKKAARLSSKQKVVKTLKTPQPKAVKESDPDPRKKPEQDGLCKDGAEKIVVSIIARLNDVIANKGDWCDGNHFAPARALLQSWLDEKIGTVPSPPKLLNKLAARSTFIDPILTHLDFVAANKDWCDGKRFDRIRGSLNGWLKDSAKMQLCKGGAEHAIFLITIKLGALIEDKGSWCDGNRFRPAFDMLNEWRDSVNREAAEDRQTGEASKGVDPGTTCITYCG